MEVKLKGGKGATDDWRACDVKRADTENPYESPRSYSQVSKSGSHAIPGRGVVRMLALGVVGYGVFAAFAVFYQTLTLYSSGEPVAVYWGMGVLCALPFASSEFFNVGRGKEVGVVRRILVASAIMLSSVFISPLIVNAIGWARRTYHDHLAVLRTLVICLLVYAITLLVVRHVWIVRGTSKER